MIDVYKAYLNYAENVNLDYSDELDIQASDMDSAVSLLDTILYRNGEIGSTNDYYISYDSNEEEAEVEFGDSERGLPIKYTITKL